VAMTASSARAAIDRCLMQSSRKFARAKF